MPRRREIPKRDVPPDPLYNNTLVTRFLRTIMLSGKRSTAEGILYGSLDIIKERTGDDPMKVFKKAIDNVKPTLEVKSRRVGGSNYQVPIEVHQNRRLSLSIRWLVGYARAKRRPGSSPKCGAPSPAFPTSNRGATRRCWTHCLPATRCAPDTAAIPDCISGGRWRRGCSMPT